MEFKGTPGPWQVHERPTEPREYGHHVITDYGLTICHVSYQPPAREGETTRVANARLIAAAPDLLLELVALREAIIAHMAGSDTPMNDPYIDKRLAFSADAIAKATGETA